MTLATIGIIVFQSFIITSISFTGRSIIIIRYAPPNFQSFIITSPNNYRPMILWRKTLLGTFSLL